MRIEQTQTATYETTEEAHACIGLVGPRLRARVLRDLRTLVDDRRLHGRQDIPDFDELPVTIADAVVVGNEVVVTGSVDVEITGE